MVGELCLLLGQKIILIFFFRKVYNKDLHDPEQPLLVHRPKEKELQRVSFSTILLTIPLKVLTFVTLVLHRLFFKL